MKKSFLVLTALCGTLHAGDTVVQEKTRLISENQQSGWASRGTGAGGVAKPAAKKAEKPKAKAPAAKAVPDKQWVLTGVRFETGSDTLKSESKNALDEAVQVLKQNSRVVVEIQGHTDNVGSASINTPLSQRRAEAVKNYLINNGISSNRLKTAGYGDSKPLVSNDSEDGRAKNRRIEFKVLSR